jgi:hypothetical protein
MRSCARHTGILIVNRHTQVGIAHTCPNMKQLQASTKFCHEHPSDGMHALLTTEELGRSNEGCNQRLQPLAHCINCFPKHRTAVTVERQEVATAPIMDSRRLSLLETPAGSTREDGQRPNLYHLSDASPEPTFSTCTEHPPSLESGPEEPGFSTRTLERGDLSSSSVSALTVFAQLNSLRASSKFAVSRWLNQYMEDCGFLFVSFSNTTFNQFVLVLV